MDDYEDDEPDIREQIFHNNVRELIVSRHHSIINNVIDVRGDLIKAIDVYGLITSSERKQR